MSQATLCLFGDDAEQARRDAIDELHSATCIYTREPVVNSMLDLLPPPVAGARFADVSCGDGVVVAAGLTRLLRARFARDEELPELVSGYELHPHAAAEARARIVSVLVAHGRSGAVATRLAERMIINRDFLTEGPTAPVFSTIAGNPPYLIAKNIPKLLRDEYAGVIPEFARSDMLHSFLERAARALRPGGTIGLITADRWLGNKGAATLRAHLAERFDILHLYRLDAAKAFEQPKLRRAGTAPRVHPVLIVLGPDGVRPLTHAPVPIGTISDRYNGIPLLGSLASVKIAPWMGRQGIFILSAEEARAAGIPAEVLVPALGARQLKGASVGPVELYAIHTVDDQVPCAAVMAHLEKNIHKIPPRGRRNPMWLSPESWKREDLSLPRLVVPRIVKEPRALAVPPGYLPVNHNVSILGAEPALLQTIQRAIHGDVARQWVTEHADRLEGGYVSITPDLLRRMPIDRRAPDAPRDPARRAPDA